MSIEHRWSFPNDMHRSYAFLFQTVETLRVQMSAELWQLVYDRPAARDRSVAWVRELVYTRRHMLASERKARGAYDERMLELRENEIRLDATTLGEAIRRQEKAIRTLDMAIARNRLMSFAPPTKTEDPHSGSVFEVQSDGLYCGVHALNNMARSLLFAPPDVLSAIECTRTLDECCASPEDLMLMSLREGIFLLQLKLTDIDDADQLTGGTFFPQLLERAGALLIYQPSGYGTGHYVPLLRIRDQWLIFSTDAVVVRSASASDALHTYAALSSRVEIAAGQTARAARIAAVEAGGHRPPFIGLLPLDLDCMWDAKPSNALRGIMTRSLLRRALSDWHLVRATDPAVYFDMSTPTPLSPCAIEELGWVIRYEPPDGAGAAIVRCAGTETVNPASFIGARHAMYRELNRLAEELVHSIRHTLYSETISLLRQLRSYLRATPALDCLFCTSDNEVASEVDGCDVDGIEARGDYAYALMSNRRWLRLVALVIASTTVLTQISGEDNGQLTNETFKIAMLICVLCYTNMRGYGVPTSPNLSAAWECMTNDTHWSALLPCDSMPASIRAAHFGRPGGVAEMCAQVLYDGTIWLLQSVAHLRSFPLQPALLAALRGPDGAPLDDNRALTDRKFALVAALRSTLFALPLLGADSDVVAGALHEQWCFESAELAQHNRDAIAAFTAECKRIAGRANGAAVAANAIDVLAFDSTYITDTSRELPSGEDEVRPRFLERAARAGFVHMHRSSFGRIDSNFDVRERQPATQNPDRVELPDVAGSWYTARVRSTAPRLAVAPLSQLASHFAL